MGQRRKRNYDYNSKPRDWRRDRKWDRWRNTLVLIIGLGIAGYIVYLAVVK